MISYKNISRGLMALVAGLGIATTSNAAIQDTVTFTNVQPKQSTNLAAGTYRVHNFTNTGYTLGRIDFSGTIEEINETVNDFGTENKVRVYFPDGRTQDVTLSTTTGYDGVLNFSGSFNIADGATTPYSGPWAFSFVNTFDDAPTGGVPDSKVTVTFNLTDEVGTPPDPPAFLGTFGPYGTQESFDVQSHGDGGQVRWFRLILSEAVNGTRYLDIDNETSGISDPEIALYNSAGVMLATDDDDGSAFLSQLSFGPGGGTRSAEGNGAVYNGRDGNLPAGTYYIAVAGFNAVFTNNFTVTTNSTATGTVNVRVRAGGVPGSGGVAPVLAAIGNQTGTVGVEMTFTASATDGDGDAITYGVSGPDGALMDATSGVFTWTPDANGTYPVTVVAMDARGLFDFEVINIEVGGGGGGGETIFPNVVTVTEGDDLGGELSVLQASDDTYYSLLSDAFSLGGTVILDGVFTTAPGTTMDFKLESSVARLGLAQEVYFWNWELGQYELKSGINAPGSDSLLTINTTNMSYVAAEGNVKAKVRWVPINDEDPALDGWELRMDLVSWTLD